MKRLLIASSIGFALPYGSAFAADMLLKAPVAPCVWCGWYVGGIAGYTWSDPSAQTATTTLSSISRLGGNIAGAVATQGSGNVAANYQGFAGGGELGYNQRYKDFIVGIETDFQGVGRNGQGAIVNVGTVPGASNTITSTGTLVSSRGLDYLGTVRGRIGFTPVPTVLPFVTAGLAYGRVSTSTSVTETLSYTDTPLPFGTAGSLSRTPIGWTVGGGLEWMFAPKWSAKIEYLYYDLGPVTNFLPPIQQFGGLGTVLETVSAVQSSTRFAGSDVRAGINYHFGGP